MSLNSCNFAYRVQRVFASKVIMIKVVLMSFKVVYEDGVFGYIAIFKSIQCGKNRSISKLRSSKSP